VTNSGDTDKVVFALLECPTVPYTLYVEYEITNRKTGKKEAFPRQAFPNES